MNPIGHEVLRVAALGVSILALATACGRTTQETVLASRALKVVAVTESRLDINVSEYRHHTTHVLYADGERLSDHDFAARLKDPEASGAAFVHSDAVVLDDDAVLLASHTRDGQRCWTTRLSDRSGRAVLETLTTGSVDCSPRPAPAGWSVLYDEPGNLMLVQHRPFAVHRLEGYWQVLWIDGDVVALFGEDEANERFLVRLARISTAAVLAEQALPMPVYADPRLLDVSPAARRQWLLDNFTVVMQPVSIHLRPDNRLATLTPETWAQYKAIEQENRDEDARVRAAAEARQEAEERAHRQGHPPQAGASPQPERATATD